MYQRRHRRHRVWWRESLRGSTVSSVLVTDIVLSSPGHTAAALVLALGEAYFAGLGDSCAGLVVAEPADDDPHDGRTPAPACAYDLRVLSPRTPLLRLGAPSLQTADRWARLKYPISGGVLVRGAKPSVDLEVGDGREDLGTFAFDVMVAGRRATLAVRVDGFHARLVTGRVSPLGGLLYGATESVVHRLMVARFLKKYANAMAE